MLRGTADSAFLSILTSLRELTLVWLFTAYIVSDKLPNQNISSNGYFSFTENQELNVALVFSAVNVLKYAAVCKSF